MPPPRYRLHVYHCILFVLFCGVFGFWGLSLWPLLSKRKKILFVTHEYSLTGAPRVTVEAAAILSELGHDVTILSSQVPAVNEEMVIADLFRELNGFKVDLVAGRATEVGADAKAIAAAHAIAWKSDVVIVSSAALQSLNWIERFLAASALNASPFKHSPKLGWWIHEGGSVMGVYPPSATKAPIRRIVQDGGVDFVLYPSEYARSWWVKAAKSYSLDLGVVPSRVIKWGIPPWRMKPISAAVTNANLTDTLRKHLGVPLNAFLFVTVAYFHPIKGHAGIVSALKLAQSSCEVRGAPIHFLAMGGNFGAPGNFPNGVEGWEADSSLHFMGPSQDIYPVLAAGDAYVSNTQMGGETWGLATLEALAARRVVLASDAGATSEQLKHGESALIHTLDSEGRGDVKELAHNMCLVYTDKALVQRLVRGGETLVEQTLSPSRVKKELTEALGFPLNLRAALKKGGIIH